MKNLIIILFTTLGTFRSFAQELKIADLKTPNSPGFQILDIAPSSIERPTNPKEFSLKIISLIGNGNALPKNFAFEFSPFWFLKSNNDNIYKYLNVRMDSNASQKWNIGSGFIKKLSLSIASTFSDSTVGTLLKNTNYFAFGARTNILTIRTGSQNKKMSDAILAAATRQSTVSGGIDPAGNTRPLEDIERDIDHDTTFQKNIEVLKKLPLLQLDAAYAYSNAYEGNEYSNGRFNRSGFWVTLAVNAQFKKSDHFVSLVALFKSSQDNVLTDTTKALFDRKSSYDYGGKFEYNISRFNISIEYLKRHYNEITLSNVERTVGILQYKINDNLYVLGTFGKNFGNYKNVFTLLGINWGFGNSSLRMKE